MSQFREYYLAGHFIDVQLGDGQRQQFRIAASKPKNIKIEGDIIDVIEIAALEAAQREIAELKSIFSVQLDILEQNKQLTAALKVAEDALMYMTEDFDCPAEDVALFDMLKAKEALAEIQKIKKGLG